MIVGVRTKSGSTRWSKPILIKATRLCRVKLRGLDFVVFTAPTLVPANVPGEESLGVCTSRRTKHKRAIFLNSRQCSAQMVETILHECLHGYYDAKMHEREVTALAADLSKALMTITTKLMKPKPRRRKGRAR